MKHTFEYKIFYSDTDDYKVVWHGSYLRIFEMGRVLWSEMLGTKLSDLEKDNIVLPVTNINISYKTPAMLEDIVVVETSLEKYTPLYAVFKQQMFNKDTNKLLCEALVTVVAVDGNGKLYRKLPDRMIELFEKATK